MLKSRIKVKLAELNMKQSQLADMLGVSKQTLSAWCNGHAIPTLYTAFNIAKILDCKVDDLFTYEE